MELFLCQTGLAFGLCIGLWVLLLRLIIDGRTPERITLGAGAFRTHTIVGQLEDRWSSRERFWGRLVFQVIPLATLKAVALLTLLGAICSFCAAYRERSTETFENSFHRIDASISSCSFPLPSGSDAGLALLMPPSFPQEDAPTGYTSNPNTAPP